MSSGWCILKSQVAGVMFRCRVAVYLEMSCSRVNFRCRLVGVF